MCGICGYISKNKTSDQTLWEMTGTLSHRGPDDSGILQHEADGWHIGFGHRRLSIFDLSKLGHQPMETSDGSLAVTYNGEIYNFKALRRELEKEGCRFSSNCDTEVLLYAYKQWGDGCVTRFNGMFAFALFDKQNSRILFARDRMGKKPMYYYHNGHTLIFGSEMKPLMKHPEFRKDINTQLLAMYMTRMYICSPDTIFKNTYKLEPGHMLIWENGAISKLKYWDLLSVYRQKQAMPVTDAVKAKEGFKAELRESVRLRLEADVPVGVFLSGGIDSSLVAATAAEALPRPVKTFTIGFNDKKRNEAGRAKKIAEHLGTQHTELYVSDDDIISMTADIPLYYDEPFADSSQIPTMLVSKLARQDVTVALSGDGGDELFCGYETYDTIHKAYQSRRAAGAVRGFINLFKATNLPVERWVEKYTPRAIRRHVNKCVPGTKVQFDTYKDGKISGSIVKGASDPVFFNIENEINCTDWVEKRMLIDSLTYLPDEILCKTDRASMRYALELRCPLLDVNVVEYAFSVPLGLKYRNGEKKWLLKQAAYDYIPHELLDMPKRGFGVPMNKWLRGPLKPMAEKYTNKEILERQGIFNPDLLTIWVSNLSRTDSGGVNVDLLWNYLVFQLWYQEYIEDLW